MFSRVIQIAVYAVIPLIGLIFFGWDWRPILLLYWLENISVGVVNVFAMIRSPLKKEPTDTRPGYHFSNQTLPESTPRAVLILLFLLHYGFFTFAHGGLITLLVFGDFFFLPSFYTEALPRFALQLDILWLAIFWLGGMVVQIIILFRQPKAELPAVMTLFSAPYSRILILHFTILVGIGLIFILKWPPIAAVILVALHLATDLLAAKRSSHR